jgi:hypothetical protein
MLCFPALTSPNPSLRLTRHRLSRCWNRLRLGHPHLQRRYRSRRLRLPRRNRSRGREGSGIQDRTRRDEPNHPRYSCFVSFTSISLGALGSGGSLFAESLDASPFLNLFSFPPSSFASHTYDRDIESEIADQLIGGTPLGHTVDLMLGGGLCFFQPNTTDFPKSCRPDQINAITQAESNGYNFFSTRAGFDALAGGETAPLPFAGIFTSGHMSCVLLFLSSPRGLR